MDCNLVSELFFYCNVSVPKCKSFAPHLTRYYDLTFVLDGTFTYVLDGKTVVLKKNDAMLVPPGTMRQRLAGTTPVSYVSFNFYAKDSAVFPEEIHMKNVISPAVRHMVSALPQKHLSPLFYTKEKTCNVLNYVLFELMDAHALKSRNVYIAEIVKYIHENVSVPITLADISKHVHLSKEYTAKLFKKEMGVTTTEFIHKTKMKMAKDLIFSDKISLLELSNQLGYFNYSYFTRTFKSFFGYSPAEYRKKVHKK